jgi:hypothetical protein
MLIKSLETLTTGRDKRGYLAGAADGDVLLNLDERADAGVGPSQIRIIESKARTDWRVLATNFFNFLTQKLQHG